MGKIAKDNEINFNYPIPKSVHKKVKLLQLETGMSVKDIVINALIMYITHMNDALNQDEMADKVLRECHVSAWEDDE